MNNYTKLIEELRITSHLDPLREICAVVIEQLIKERNAAVEDLEAARGVCRVCRYCNACGTPIEDYCDGENWEWRGVVNADS